MPNDRDWPPPYIPPVVPEPERGTSISDNRFNTVASSVSTPEEDAVAWARTVSMNSTVIPTNFRDALGQYAAHRVVGNSAYEAHTREEIVDSITQENENMPTSNHPIDSYEFNRELIAQRIRGYPRYDLSRSLVSPSFISELNASQARSRGRGIDPLNNTTNEEPNEVSMPTNSIDPDIDSNESYEEPTPSRDPSGDSTDTILRDLRLRYTHCYGYIEDGKGIDISKIFFVLNFDVSLGDVVNIQYMLADGSAPKIKPWDKNMYIFDLPKLGYINANYLAVLFKRRHKKSENNKFKRGFQYGLYPPLYLNPEESRKAEISPPNLNQLNEGSSVFGYKMYLSLLSEDSYIPYAEAISGIITGQRLSTALNNKYVLELVTYLNIIILKRLQFVIGVYDQAGKKFITSNELFNKELDNLNIPYEYVRGSI
jgi:hypothetical protein